MLSKIRTELGVLVFQIACSIRDQSESDDTAHNRKSSSDEEDCLDSPRKWTKSNWRELSAKFVAEVSVPSDPSLAHSSMNDRVISMVDQMARWTNS